MKTSQWPFFIRPMEASRRRNPAPIAEVHSVGTVVEEPGKWYHAP